MKMENQHLLNKLNRIFPDFTGSLLNSYSQVFFSNNRIFALMLMAVSFFDFWAGLSGVITVITTNIFAYIGGLSRKNIALGAYGFNSLLVGLGLGVSFEPGLAYFIILIFSALSSLIFTQALEGIIGKYGLPFLSIPFLIVIWLFTLATREFSALEFSTRGIYTYNEMFLLGGDPLVQTYSFLSEPWLPVSLSTYFKSLAAVFFQYHLVAGILVSIGLLIYSRIAFLYSLIGFYSAYALYGLLGADINELSYGYIGFNYILTAIAIGGFFLVASRYTLLWLFLLTPIITVIIVASGAVLDSQQLPAYSLPFNVVVLLFLYFLKFRERFTEKPLLVYYQLFSPERNLYAQHNYHQRFGTPPLIPLSLPIWGEWTVTQGHNGEFTHREKWREAWDFEIRDEDGDLYRNEGTRPEDYYCYAKPVTAPADGYVEEILNGINDSPVGDMDLTHNWGNTIIIRHSEHFYTKMSHLKKDSFKVIKGQWVQRGEVIALAGSSGRSPRPHLHFQVQEFPYIGSYTLPCALSSYIRHNKSGFEYVQTGIPLQDEVISNIQPNEAIASAFRFIPGQLLKFKVKNDDNSTKEIVWEVKSDSYNNTYLWSETGKASAWYKNDGKVMWFTHFEGDKRSLLYYFYLGAYKIINGFYKGMVVEDQYPLHIISDRRWLFMQDFISPFCIFMNSSFKMLYRKMDDQFSDSYVYLDSSASMKIFGKTTSIIDFRWQLHNNLISKFVIVKNNRSIEVEYIHD